MGNKCDLIEEEEPENSEAAKQGIEKAEKYGVVHRIGSAKNGIGINEAFADLASRMVTHYGGENQQSNIQLLPKLRISKRENCNC